MSITELPSAFRAASDARERLDSLRDEVRSTTQRVEAARGRVAQLEEIAASGKGLFKRRNADAAATAAAELGPAQAELVDAEASVRALKDEVRAAEADAKRYELARAKFFSELEKVQGSLRRAGHPAAAEAQGLLDHREVLVAELDRTDTAIKDRHVVAEALELAVDHAREARFDEAVDMVHNATHRRKVGPSGDTIDTADTANAHLAGAVSAIDSILEDLYGLDADTVGLDAPRLVEAARRVQEGRTIFQSQGGVIEMAKTLRAPVAELAEALPDYRLALIAEVKRIDAARVDLLLTASEAQ